MVVLVFVKDSHLSFVKTLTQSVSCSLQIVTILVPARHTWNPNRAGTKMVTLEPVETTTNQPWPSQAEPRYACGNIP